MPRMTRLCSFKAKHRGIAGAIPVRQM
ncbi:hypothetical protein SPHINGO8AM_40247 [Sphingomonas sp. 8AM]|nr:hypothetical protein SPHINGO8AM_40247 [Sphingomonas sp. 8AM]